MTTKKENIFLKERANRILSKFQKAIEALSKDIITLDSSKTLWDARNNMLRYNISRIVVTSRGKAVGIVTEKDISRFLYKAPPTTGLKEIALKELLKKKLVTVGEESNIDYCVKLMLENNISSLLLMDNQEKSKGIITKTDIVMLFAYHQYAHMPVGRVMSKKVHTVTPDETLHTVAMLLTTYNISRVVVEKNGKPVGIVTTRDFLPISLLYGTGTFGRYWTTSKNAISRKTRQNFVPSGVLGVTLAQDIMTVAPLSVQTTTDICDAAKIMIGNKISGLPVVNVKGDLVGIITKTDVAKAVIT